MTDALSRYLDKRADLVARPLVAASVDAVEQVVVIPVLAEREHLPQTLKSIARNPAAELERTLVLCVVNNGAPGDCEAHALEENRETLAELDAQVHGEGPIRVAYIDASSPGQEFPAGEGVGLARKIGMDWGLEVFRRNACESGIIISLDADTTVEANYLGAVKNHFAGDGVWAGVIDYAHSIAGPPDQQAAMLCYEFFLRYHVLGLRRAGSPYAFHAIGSTIACTAEAYAAVSGMNRRRGGEDFYFLQQLAKTGPVAAISTTTVHPSPRPSWRVPFGTGPRVSRFLEGKQNEYLVYHPDSYEILRAWLDALAARPETGAAELLNQARNIAPPLETFLQSNNFDRTWERLQQNAAGESALVAQFHRWFDGLKTLRLIHHLRDEGYPEQDLFESIALLLDRSGKAAPGLFRQELQSDLQAQQCLLEHLRAL